MAEQALPRNNVVGAGAIGGLFAARLTRGHADVSVVARDDATLQAPQTFGLLKE